jgi:hypothetical protein
MYLIVCNEAEKPVTMRIRYELKTINGKLLVHVRKDQLPMLNAYQRVFQTIKIAPAGKTKLAERYVLRSFWYPVEWKRTNYIIQACTTSAFHFNKQWAYIAL